MDSKKRKKSHFLLINKTLFWEQLCFLSKKKYTEGRSKNELLGKNMETLPKHGGLN